MVPGGKAATAGRRMASDVLVNDRLQEQTVKLSPVTRRARQASPGVPVLNLIAVLADASICVEQTPAVRMLPYHWLRGDVAFDVHHCHVRGSPGSEPHRETYHGKAASVTTLHMSLFDCFSENSPPMLRQVRETIVSLSLTHRIGWKTQGLKLLHVASSRHIE
jgi:hypothetical protein